MKVLDPGHRYRLAEFDGFPGQLRQHALQFVKRDGPGYPGNRGFSSGTNCQELLRVLIDRAKYLEGQEPSYHNELIIEHLRAALVQFEYRAASRHGCKAPKPFDIENQPFCSRCGHVGCTESTCASRVAPVQSGRGKEGES